MIRSTHQSDASNASWRCGDEIPTSKLVSPTSSMPMRCQMPASLTSGKRGKDRTRGFFGLAGHNDPVEFRSISIKEL